MKLLPAVCHLGQALGVAAWGVRSQSLQLDRPRGRPHQEQHEETGIRLIWSRTLLLSQLHIQQPKPPADQAPKENGKLTPLGEG